MFAGVLAAHPFATSLTGDESLRRRPMRRIIVPLERMGCRIGSDDGRPPLTIEGTAGIRADRLRAGRAERAGQERRAAGRAACRRRHVRHRTAAKRATTPSADCVRSACRCGQDGPRGATRGAASACRPVTPASARRHLVRGILDGGGGVASGFGNRYRRGRPEPDSHRHHRRAPADGGVRSTSRATRRRAGEPMGRLVVRHGGVGATEVLPTEVPGVIDELPVLAALATHGGELRVTGAQELRVKESDRISALAEGLRRMGGRHRRAAGRLPRRRATRRCAAARSTPATITVSPWPSPWRPSAPPGPTIIHDAGAAAVSYPEFFDVLDAVRA